VTFHHSKLTDAAGPAVETADHLTGPAGSVTVHNCRVVQGSKPNLSDVGRPLLVNVYAAADAFPYTANPLPSRYGGANVRGRADRWAHHEPRPCLVPPESGGYTSLFALAAAGELGGRPAGGGGAADRGHPRQ
jgi:hypothetical protein